MPLGIVCAQCSPDPVTFRYPVFATSMALCEHIATQHPDPGGMILVNWAADEDNEDDDEDEEQMSGLPDLSAATQRQF